jgi:ParB family chromosome partitioning protein
MLAEQTIKNNLSVREVEELVKKLQQQTPSPSSKHSQAKPVSHDVLRLQEALSDKLGATVNISPRQNGAGVLKISYANLDQLDEIIAKISR